MKEEQMEPKFKETWQEVSKKWDAGENVWSAELGGIGPGYEQAIQILLFELLSRWPKGKKIELEAGAKEYPKEWKDFADEVSHQLSEKHGFSGAQVGNAQATAFQFIHYGYAEMMNKLPSDREILVSKSFNNEH